MFDKLRRALHKAKNIEEIKSIDFMGYKINMGIDQYLKASEGEKLERIKKDWYTTKYGLQIRIKNEEEPVIIGILMTKSFLQDLGVNTEDDVNDIFGSPYFKEKRMGEEYYFYNRTGLFCRRNYISETIESIGIGELGIKPQEYKVNYLLHRFLKLMKEIPDRKKWEKSLYPEKDGRYIKLIILESLMKAFEVDCDVKELDIGKFISKKPEHLYEALIDKIAEDIETICTSNIQHTKALKIFLEKKGFLKRDLQQVYSFLFRFYINLKSILNYNAGWLEAGSTGSQYLIHKVNQILSSFERKKLRELEEIICETIDPKNLTFTQKELVEKYDYPGVDIGFIESNEY